MASFLAIIVDYPYKERTASTAVDRTDRTGDSCGDCRNGRQSACDRNPGNQTSAHPSPQYGTPGWHARPSMSLVTGAYGLPVYPIRYPLLSSMRGKTSNLFRRKPVKTPPSSRRNISWPVRIAAREGEQDDTAQYAFVNRTPSIAKLSMAGVLTALPP